MDAHRYRSNSISIVWYFALLACCTTIVLRSMVATPIKVANSTLAKSKPIPAKTPPAAPKQLKSVATHAATSKPDVSSARLAEVAEPPSRPAVVPPVRKVTPLLAATQLVQSPSQRTFTASSNPFSSPPILFAKSESPNSIPLVEFAEPTPVGKVEPDTTSEPLQTHPRQPEPIAVPEPEPEPFRESSTTIDPFWWREFVLDTILSRETVPISPGELAIKTLQHSPTVTLLAARPQAVRTTVIEEAARFDWNMFVESRWRDTTEPIGSSLTTGGPNVYRNHELTNEAGVNRTNRMGGELSIGQRFGNEQSNSQFFLPPNQGATTLTIDYSQPLLQGAGRAINESNIVLATLASDSADMEFVSQVQDLLTDVNRGYWQLYLSRATLLIERRLYHRATKTLDILRKRESVDASKEMISRAELAIASRKARLITARRVLLDQQSFLRNVVNSPDLDRPEFNEFVPTGMPVVEQLDLSVEDAFVTAVQNRPEIASSLAQIRSANVRQQIAENELLPELNLVLQTYAQGLRGNFDLEQAFSDQFNGAEPSYSAGLLFQVPIGRRAANARRTRREIEVGEMTAQFRVELERILFDVTTQLRQLDATRRSLQTNLKALVAASETLRLLETRHRLLSSEQDRNSSLRLQDILNSHVRVSDAEIAVVRSQVEHTLAMNRLRRSLGVLVRPSS